MLLVVPVSARRFRALVAAIAALDAALVFATWLFFRLYESGAAWEDAPEVPRWVLAELNLNRENVVATWLSSSLMLLVAALAVACFVADRRARRSPRERRLSAGWLLLAAIFVAFSLDELGSLHENVGTLRDANPLGDAGLGWRGLLALGLAALAAAMAAFALLHVRRVPLALGSMALGAALLVAVPLQEHTDAVREEATELAAVLAFLVAALAYLAATAEGPLRAVVPRRAMLAGALAAVAVLGLGLWAFEHPLADLPNDAGIPRNWFLSAPALLAAGLALMAASAAPRRLVGARGIYLAAALLAVLLAAYYGANIQGVLTVGDVGRSARKTVNGGFILAAGVLAVALIALARPWWGRAAAVVFAVALAMALSSLENYGGERDFVAVSALLVALVAHLPAAAPGSVLRPCAAAEERYPTRPPRSSSRSRSSRSSATRS